MNRIPFPVDSWIEKTVDLPNGLRHVMVVDSAADDPVTPLYLTGSGGWVNAYLVNVMSALVKPGDRVIDLGAFVGHFALAASAQGCEVLAVEANPALADMVRYSAELNAFDNLRVLHAAIGDTAGSVAFVSDGPWGQVHPRPYATHAADPRVTQVAQLTIDELVEALGWESLAFVKVDIEGSEMRALSGASGLLAAPNAPALLIESNISPLMEHGTEPRSLLKAIESFGYTLFRVMPEEIVPCGSDDFQVETVADYLALKGRTPSEFGISTRKPLSVAETAERILRESRSEHAAHRRSLAWQLQFARPDLLEHRDVQRALKELREDPDEEVRGAVFARVEPTEPEANPVLADGRWLAERVLREGAEAQLAVAHRLQGHRPDTALDPQVRPGPMAMQVARRLSGVGRRHPRMARLARRIIRLVARPMRLRP